MASKYAIETIFKAVDNITAPIRKMDAQMGKFGAAGNAVNNALKKGFADAEKSLGKITTGLKNAVVGLQAAGVAAAGAFAVNGVKNAIEYEQSLAKLSTIANDLPLDKTSKDILAVSNTMHVAAAEITESTYNAISSGIEASKAVDFVATATKAAKAGFAETGVAIDGLTNVMNAYGMNADNAMRIADQMLVTQNLGKATFTDMAKGMGQVAPIASSLNVKTEELFASIAALTNAGIQTPQAITGIKAALSNIMKPTSQASKLADKLGLDFSAAGLQAKGWVGFLDDVKRATKGDAAMMAQLFGSVEALNSVSVLTGKGAAKLTESLDAMSSMAGITEKSFNRMMQTPKERITGLKNQFTNAGIKLGQALLPVFEKVADKVEIVINKIDSIDFDKVAASVDKAMEFVTGLIEGIWKFRKPILIVVGAFLLFKGALMAIIIFTKAWQVAQIAMNAVMLIANVIMNANPIGLIIIAIIALIGIVVLLVKNWEKVKATLVAVWEKVKGFVSFIWDKVCAAFTAFGEALKKAAGIIKNVFLTAIEAVWQPIKRIIDAFTNGGIIAGIKQIGATILKFILTPILTIMGTLSKIPVIGDKIGEAKEWIEGKIDSLAYVQNNEESKPATAPTSQAFTPYAAAQINTQHTEVNRSEMQISLDKGLNAQVNGKAPGITVQTQKTGAF